MMTALRYVLVFISCTVVFSRDVTTEEREIIDLYNKVNKVIKPDLKMDQAWLTIRNNLTFDLDLFVQNQECYKLPQFHSWTESVPGGAAMDSFRQSSLRPSLRELEQQQQCHSVSWSHTVNTFSQPMKLSCLCNMMYFDSVLGQTTKTVIANATFGTRLELRRTDFKDIFCSKTIKFKESGDYWLFSDGLYNNSGTCDIVIANDPMPAEMPILYVAVGLLGLWIIIKVISLIYRKIKGRKKTDLASKYGVESNGQTQMDTLPTSSGDSSEPITTHSTRQRLKSLDTFRGLSLMVMIFVNFGGGGYWFFEHPPWNGISVADLVFPWFVFIMGTSMNYSFRSMIKRGKSRLRILWKVIRRAAVLFGIGIILNTNWGPVDLETMRIPGVLQRLSLSYLLVALMETVFARREDKFQDRSWSWLRDIILLLPEWFLSLGILAAYLALTFALPVPGCPTGYIGPGGLHESKLHENCTGGAAGYIDRVVLGEKHLYGNPTPKKIYQTVVNYDPEGILGTLSSIFLCFLGLQAGRIFITYKEHKGRIIRLLIWAVITGAIGVGLCEGSQNEGVIPLNKNLWSVSFILVTAALGCVLLSALYIVIDVIKIWDGEPFVFPGMNPLTVYICHDLFYRCFPVNWIIDPIHWKLLLKAVWDTAIFTILAFIMYCKKVFIAL